MNTLIVDDEKIILRGSEKVFRELWPEGSFFTASDFREALDIVYAHPIDYAILDMTMPVMDGQELAMHIKLLSPSTNILFLSAYSSAFPNIREPEAEGYLMKPLLKQEILSYMKKHEEVISAPYPLLFSSNEGTSPAKRLLAKCFGTFQVYNGTDELRFTDPLVKELLALCIYMRKNTLTARDLHRIWNVYHPQQPVSAEKISLLCRDLIKTLRFQSLPGIITKDFMQYKIDLSAIDSDFEHFLNGDLRGLNLYHGVFMEGYPWADLSRDVKSLHGKK